MKKIISMLLVLMLICTFCTPAFAAEDEPVEWEPSKGLFLEPLVKGVYVGGNFEEWKPVNRGGGVHNGENHIISSGEYTVEGFVVPRDATLTIGMNAKVTITDFLVNKSNVIVAGTLDLTNCDVMGNGTFYIADCCGKLSTNDQHLKNVMIHAAHCFENGICIGCGYECENEFHNGVYVCRDCGMVAHTTATGSVLSQGSISIVVGIACAVVFGLGGFVLGRKKKPTPANAVENDEE